MNSHLRANATHTPRGKSAQQQIGQSPGTPLTSTMTSEFGVYLTSSTNPAGMPSSLQRSMRAFLRSLCSCRSERSESSTCGGACPGTAPISATPTRVLREHLFAALAFQELEADRKEEPSHRNSDDNCTQGEPGSKPSPHAHPEAQYCQSSADDQPRGDNSPSKAV